MKTIIRALLDVVGTKPYWRTSEIRDVLMNLIADTEKMELVQVPEKETSLRFSKNQILALVHAAQQPETSADIMKYIDNLYVS